MCNQLTTHDISEPKTPCVISELTAYVISKLTAHVNRVNVITAHVNRVNVITARVHVGRSSIYVTYTQHKNAKLQCIWPERHSPCLPSSELE